MITEILTAVLTMIVGMTAVTTGVRRQTVSQMSRWTDSAWLSIRMRSGIDLSRLTSSRLGQRATDAGIGMENLCKSTK